MATIMGTAVLNVVSEGELQIKDQTGGFGGENEEYLVLMRISGGFLISGMGSLVREPSHFFVIDS